MKRTFLGKAKGCTLAREFWRGLSERQRAEISVRIKDFPHLYPCPRHGGSWINKEECDYCAKAAR